MLELVALLATGAAAAAATPGPFEHQAVLDYVRAEVSGQPAAGDS